MLAEIKRQCPICRGKDGSHKLVRHPSKLLRGPDVTPAPLKSQSPLHLGRPVP